jgi:PAS domain S-box-containing protein
MEAYRTIGVMIAALSGYYWGSILTGIYQVARRNNVQLLVFQRDRADTRVPSFARAQIDGWIAVQYAEGSQAVAAAGLPVVTVATLVPGLNSPAVMADNAAGTRAVVNHLIGHGHRRIAFIGNLNQPSIQQRYNGYEAALAEHALPLDPLLVIQIPDNMEEDGRFGAQELIKRGMPCTAVVAATDRNAIGALAVLRAAGYRIPEDLAIVGFDDINAAQFTNPPLTTVRTRFEEFGRLAAEMLLAHLAGQMQSEEIIYVPATLVVRQSCGCNLRPAIVLATPPQARSWQEAISVDLLGLAVASVGPGSASLPTRLGAAISTLVQGLAATLDNAIAPSPTNIEQAWSDIVAEIPDLELLYSMRKLLAQAGAAQLASMPSDSAAAQRLDTYLDRVHVEMMRARVSREMASVDHLENLTENNYQISLGVLNAEPGYVQRLGWLEQTSVTWACLGLYPDQHDEAPSTVIVAGLYDRAGTSPAPIGRHHPIASFPPRDLLPAQARDAQPSMVLLTLIATPTNEWGILALIAPIESQLRSDRANMTMWRALIGAALDRKSLLAELAEQQDTLHVAYEQRLITENIRDLIGMLDQQGRFLYASPSYRTVLGYDPAGLAGAAIFDYAHPDDLAALRELWSLMLTVGTAQGTYRSRHAGGDWRWLEVAGTAIVRAGAPSVVIVSRDVTERRRLETELLQSQKMDSIGRLAGGVAHDFNNMLTAIGGYADLAIEGLSADDKLRGDLEEIQKATVRAANLTHQLLAFARKQLIEPKVLNLNDLILDMDKLLRRVIGEDIELISVPALDLGRVRVDPGQIEQVLVNLAVNARDAMPHGGMLTIETANITIGGDAIQHAQVASGPYVLLAVSDSGMGMSAEVRQHLFEPFFTTKPVGQGTGLGLATCYGIIKRHGGYIWPYSEVGQGTTIKIYLPRVEDAAEVRVRAMQIDQPRHGTEVVLLIEDDKAVRALAARVLRAQGYTVLDAADGEAALMICQTYAGPIDIVLTDVVMPRMSGKVLAAQLAVLRPTIKVVYMSGYTDNALFHQGQLEAEVEFLHKPFTPLALARIVRKVLDA